MLEISKYLQVGLSDESYDKVLRLAKEENRPVSQYLRLLIEGVIEKIK